jgi:hypothetical protein
LGEWGGESGGSTRSRSWWMVGSKCLSCLGKEETAAGSPVALIITRPPFASLYTFSGTRLVLHRHATIQSSRHPEYEC